jgi:hypothetical protein
MLVLPCLVQERSIIQKGKEGLIMLLEGLSVSLEKEELQDEKNF